jgi:hypothetical protein
MATVTTSKITCRVFGLMPLRSGKNACVALYMTRSRAARFGSGRKRYGIHQAFSEP